MRLRRLNFVTALVALLGQLSFYQYLQRWWKHVTTDCNYLPHSQCNPEASRPVADGIHVPRQLR